MSQINYTFSGAGGIGITLAVTYSSSTVTVTSPSTGSNEYIGLAVTGISGSTNAGAIIGQYGAAGNTNYGADNTLFLTNGTGVHQESYDGIDEFGLEFTAHNGDHIAVYNQSKTGQNFTYYDFTAGSSGESLTLTNFTNLNCFAAGTEILTLAGMVPVESINVGETVIILLNDTVSTSRVIWTCKRHVDIARAPDQDEARPIRICAGAIADGIPERDLRVSARHGHLYRWLPI